MFKTQLPLLLLITMQIFHPAFSDCPAIISRSDWNARPPTEVNPLTTNPPPFVVVHHSVTPLCNTTDACESQLRAIQRAHMKDNGWDDIGYNFIIGGDGQIYEGRGWGVFGAHAPRYNSKSIGVCLLGNFQEQQPLQVQLDALAKLVECGVENDNIDKDYGVIGHRQASATLCPGRFLFDKVKKMPHFDPINAGRNSRNNNRNGAN